jgi:hypothetical protein
MPASEPTANAPLRGYMPMIFAIWMQSAPATCRGCVHHLVYMSDTRRSIPELPPVVSSMREPCNSIIVLRVNGRDAGPNASAAPGAGPHNPALGPPAAAPEPSSAAPPNSPAQAIAALGGFHMLAQPDMPAARAGPEIALRPASLEASVRASFRRNASIPSCRQARCHPDRGTTSRHIWSSVISTTVPDDGR